MEVEVFKKLWVPVVIFVAWWIKHHSPAQNRLIPLVVMLLAVVGHSLSVVLSGGDFSWATTPLEGIPWGIGLVGLHSGSKNVAQLLGFFRGGKR